MPVYERYIAQFEDANGNRFIIPIPESLKERPEDVATSDIVAMLENGLAHIVEFKRLEPLKVSAEYDEDGNALGLHIMAVDLPPAMTLMGRNVNTLLVDGPMFLQAQQEDAKETPPENTQ